MILDHLAQADRYARLHPLFAKAFAFLRENDLALLSPGRHAIDGDQLYASVDEKPGRGRSGARLESHRQYIDIQVAVSGQEEIGWKRTAQCREVTEPFLPDNDIAFYGDDPVTWLALPPGHFTIFWPEDAHAPLAGEGALRKVIVKIAV